MYGEIIEAVIERLTRLILEIYRSNIVLKVEIGASEIHPEVRVEADLILALSDGRIGYSEFATIIAITFLRYCTPNKEVVMWKEKEKIAKLSGLSFETVNGNIAKLIKKGFIEKVGHCRFLLNKKYCSLSYIKPAYLSKKSVADAKSSEEP